MIQTPRSSGFYHSNSTFSIPLPCLLLLSSLGFSVLGNTACAGFLVGNNPGAMGGNDKIANVIAEIGEYNAANDPDLTTSITLFKKTDDDASDVFNATNDNNGFSFFEADMTTPITVESELTNSEIAYFSYSGPENISFYSVKAGSSGFSLYTFMPGLNHLELDGANKEISHVSFWTGPPGLDPFGEPLPEPSSFAMLGIGLVVFMSRFVRINL